MKRKLLISLILVGLILSGCDSKTDDAITIENRVEEVFTVGENKTLEHTANIGDSTVKFNTIYSLENPFDRGWKYTEPNTFKLGLEMVNSEGYEVSLVSVYSSVSIISTKLKYNGLRQDSLWTDYGTADAYGLPMTDGHTFKVFFDIEGLNQNETFLRIYNGTGYGGSARVDEKDCDSAFEGGRIAIVWTISFKDIETGKYYIETVKDTIGITKGVK